MNHFYNLLKPLLLLITGVCLLSTVAFAQPCGVEAKITILGGTATCGYFADTAGYQPGWIGYKYQWKINDKPPITQYSVPTIMYDELGAGFNRLQLIVYGTNTTTGDSCIAEYTNVYQATGDAIYPEFDVSVNGNTVTFTGTYKGGPFFGAPSTVMYDFGDGTLSSSNSFNESHTYANAGLKTVYLYVQMNNPTTGGVANSQVGRDINVGTGASNLEFSFIQDQSICDSVRVSASSSPAFTFGSFNKNFSVAGNAPVNGNYVHVNMIDVPGHDFIGIDGGAAGSSYDYTQYLVKLNDCTIIPDTASGYVFDDLNYNGIKEPGEPGIAGVTIYISTSCNAESFSTVQAGYSTTTDTAGYYYIHVPHYGVKVTLGMSTAYTLTYPGTNYYNVNYSSGTMHTGHDFGLSTLSVHICGRTYLDDNNDSIYNSSDRSLPAVMLTATNTITGIVYHNSSGTNGSYCFDLPPGNFVVRPVNWPLDSATFTPDSLIVSGGTGGTYSNRNFGFRSPVPTDFHLQLFTADDARPGFDMYLTCRINNTGYLKGKGDLVLNYDPLLTPLSTNPANGIINTVANTITWTTDSIPPGFSLHYNAFFNLPSSTPLGTLLSNSATITATPGTLEYDLSDNTSSLLKTVIGSFDPNDKQVTPEGLGATGDVLHNTRFDYRIRFQNTGTASAINVFVMDTIDSELDLNTFVMHRASHNYDLVINGNILTWRFFNINLPDSNTNEPLSHGFIEYSISPKPGLADGTTIENVAAIYFDFNEPVITNTTLNTMQTSLAGILDTEANDQLLVYPNPTSQDLTVLPRFEISGMIDVSIVDLLGKHIQTVYKGTYQHPGSIKANVSPIAKGMYLLRIQHQGGISQVKWIKQ
ncbi:MAG: T9SS type A sorting domain-containing protein [Bacteroidetes bacterium]|nr:T9SS type A sorting domain-containing protein [Bacteroidota bacterium]